MRIPEKGRPVAWTVPTLRPRSRNDGSERAVRPLLVVVEAPGFDLLLRILERDELMHVQALLTQAPVEGLDVGILHRFARMDEVEGDAAVVRPVFEGAG
jgi:hypothetical protein